MDNNARRRSLLVAAFALVIVTGIVPVGARQAPARPAEPQATPQSRAPIDLTGYWVSVVTEDWLWRMVTPSKGNYARVPLNAEGRRVADTWDPARDASAGMQCRPFGVGGLMRMPGRLNISWRDAQTLRIDADAGTQTRVINFGVAQRPSGQRTWQGWSVGEWELVNPADPKRGGSLKVVTTSARAAYLRKNGVPYSEDMVMTEHFDRHNEPNGDQWFTVTTIVEDPKYLTQPFVTTTHFKREGDGSKWHPTGCEIAPPIK